MRNSIRLQVLGWTMVACLDFGLGRAAHPEDELHWAVYTSLSLALVGAGLTALLLLAYLKWLPSRGARAVWLSVVGTVGGGLLWYAALMGLDSLVGYPYQASSFVDGLFGKGILCFFILAAWHGIFAAIEASQQMIQAQRLASEAQLMALRYQLSPHFLFNAINSAIALIDEDPQRAQKMLTLLSGLLRETLRSETSADAPLASEMAIIERYIEIQKVRFEEDIVVSLEVSEHALKCELPPLLLHTLVENAVKHGYRTSDVRPLKIAVEAQDIDDSLQLRVRNTGRLEQSNGGIGVKNVQSRLDAAYPGRHSFELAEHDGVVTATVAIRSPRRI